MIFQNWNREVSMKNPFKKAALKVEKKEMMKDSESKKEMAKEMKKKKKC